MASKSKSKDTSRAKSAKSTDSQEVVTLKNQIQKLRAEVEILKNNFDRSRVPKSVIESQDLGAIIQESYMNTLEELNKLKEEKGAVLGSDAKALEAKLQKTTKELNECETTRKRITEELHVERQRIALLERENQTLKSESGQKLESNTVEDKKRIHELEKTVDMLQQERDKLQKDLMAVREDNTDLRRKLALLNNKSDAPSSNDVTQNEVLSELQGRLDAAKREYQQEQLRSKQLQDELKTSEARTEDKINQAEIEKRQLNEKVASLTKKLEVSVKQDTDSNQNRQELSRLLQERTEELDALKKNMLDRNKELDDLSKQMVSRNDSIDSVTQSLRREQESKGELEKLVEGLKKDTSNLQARIQQLEQQANNRDKSNGNDEDVNRLRAMIQTLNEELQTVKKEKEDAKMAISQHKNDLHEAFVNIDKKEKELENMKKTHDELIERKDKTINTLRRESSIVDPTGGKPTLEVQKLEKQIQTLTEENVALQTRVSQLSGAKLQDSNSGITNLSDENRPTKLAEKFSELYDNEWTEAYEEQEEDWNNEKETIQYLYKMLLDIYSFCQSLAKKHAESLQKACLMLSGQSSSNSKIPEMQLTQKRLLKDVLKSFANWQVNDVYQHFLETNKLSNNKNTNTLEYIKKAVEICWYMVFQDPPVVIDTNAKPSDSFDTDVFKVYTAKGKHIDYIVWPPLLLHKDGPMVGKGVAQGK